MLDYRLPIPYHTFFVFLNWAFCPVSLAAITLVIMREQTLRNDLRNDTVLPRKVVVYSGYKKYMLFAGWEVRIVKNCDRGLENAARGRRPRAAFSRPRSQFFTIRTDQKPVNTYLFFSYLIKKTKKIVLQNVFVLYARIQS